MDPLKKHNYRQVRTCANCRFSFDCGINEEDFECENKKISPDSAERKEVEHDYICDLYEPRFI